MKMKKIISAFLAISLAASATAISAFAASPIVLTNDGTVKFEQNFGGLNGASDLTDFDVSDEWQYFDAYMGQQVGGYKCNGSVITKESYDLSSYSYWEFETIVLAEGNGYNIYLGWDEAAGKGYKLNWKNDRLTVQLFKAGNATAVAETEKLSTLYGAVAKYNVIYNNGKLSVKMNSKEVLTYDLSASDFNGKFGVQGAATTMFILFDMKLTTGGSTTVNRWIYEEEFDGETVYSLKEKGWTLPASATVVEGKDSYISAVSKSEVKYNIALTGNYGIKAKQRNGYNANQGYMTIKSSDGSYYLIKAGEAKTNTAAQIIKYDASTKTTTVLKKTSELDCPDYATFNYDVKVYTNSNETKIAANIDVYVDSTFKHTITMEATDTKSDDNTPIASVKEVSFSWGSQGSGNCNLYNFTTYSIIDDTEKEDIQINKVATDKNFTGADTYTTVGNAGFYRGPNKESADWGWKNYPEYDDEYGMSYESGKIYYYHKDANNDYSVKANICVALH